MPDAARTLPSVSVVIPTVDRPDMLARALRSVLDQSYEGCIECIVVFDHVEPTIEPRQESATRVVRVATNTRRQGLAGNRNTGYLLATGDYVCPCDDDDEWLPQKVEAQVALLRERPDAVLAGCGFVVCVDGRETERVACAEPLTFADLLRGRHMEVNSSTYMVRRRDLLDRIGLIDEDLPGGYGEDYEWALRATRLGPAVCVPRPLVRINWHEQSFFGSRWRTVADALTYLLAQVPEFAGEPRGRARIEGQIALAHAALGDRGTAMRGAVRALQTYPAARQAWGALIVASGLMTPAALVALGRRFGHGV
jgi:glycosyltransferase involved in cell wall biosynthesis